MVALILMGAWLQIRNGVSTQKCTKNRARGKGPDHVLAGANVYPCKKIESFCDGEVFFVDRGLLMGAPFNAKPM